MELEKLFENFEKDDSPAHREELGEEKIVFVHESFHQKNGSIFQFTDEEFQVLNGLLNKTKLPLGSYQFVAAVKLFGAREDDIDTPTLHKHREYLYEDIEAIDPDLIIPLGNLALKTLTKKSGITAKRGKEFSVEISKKNYNVVPTLHPFSLYAEPKMRPLFIQDVDNAYDKFILNINAFDDSPYELVNGDLDRAKELLNQTLQQKVVGVDLETNGLDFKMNKIFTIGFSFGEKQGFVFPIFHRESEWSDNDLSELKQLIQNLMESDVTKVFHNCKFDLKFLMNWGITHFESIEDTQVMHSLVDENLPHGLMDLVKQYFPTELEKF
jgi:uracil-DNA glycosylase family 4